MKAYAVRNASGTRTEDVRVENVRHRCGRLGVDLSYHALAALAGPGRSHL